MTRDRNPWARLLLLLAALGTPVFAQGLHFGLKAGVPATTYFETGQTGGLHGACLRRLG